MSEILLYTGSAVIFLWGIGHMVPTKPIVADFGAISPDNNRIITMEWVAEGLTLCFIGAVVFVATLTGDSANPVSRSVYGTSALMLLILAVLSSLTGARTSILPMKLCPYVKTAVAIAFVLAIVF